MATIPDSHYDILIFQSGGELPPSFREKLKAKGMASSIKTDIRECGEALLQLKQPIFITIGSEDDQETINNVRSLVANKELHDFPLIIVGKDAAAAEPVLKQYFDLVVTISVPYNLWDLFSAVDFVIEKYPRFIERKRFSVETSNTAAEPTPQETPPQIVDKPAAIFNYWSKLKLNIQNLGGKEYRLSQLGNQKHYLPKDRSIQSTIGLACADAGKWYIAHLHRLAFLNSRILETLAMPAALREAAQAAAFLYMSSFAQRNRALTRIQYHYSNSQDIRSELCSRLKDSAMKLTEDLKSPLIGNIVSTTARYIGHEQSPGEDEVSIVASTLMTLDMIDRACYPSGLWDSRGAYTVLRKLRNNEISNIHPQVLACVIKILSEAISIKTSAALVPKHLRTNKKLLLAASQNKNQEVSENETKVELADLIPGMTISRPFFAFDGTQILSGDLKLDPDLIMLLWQLSAVSRLNVPVLVEKE